MNTSTLGMLPRTAAAARPRLAATMAWYGVIVLVVTTVFGAIDRQILILLAEPMRRSLAFSDTQIGVLEGLGITLFGGIAALPVAALADRFGRRLVLACSVVVWGAATAVCAFAHQFAVLYAATVGLGIGEAAVVPIVYALLPGIVPARQRVLVNGIYTVASIFGAGLGIALSGTLVQSVDALRAALPGALQSFEPWRLAFLAVALPAPVVALLVLRIRRHPDGESPETADAPDAGTLHRHVRANVRAFAGVYVGCALATFGLSAASHWLPVVAARQFHASTFDIGRGFGLAYILGTVIGAPIGGAGVRWLRARLGVGTALRIVLAGLVLAGLATLAGPWIAGPRLVYALFGAEVACIIGASVVLPTLLQDMLPASLRSRGVALFTLLTALLSAASPVLVGLLSDAMPRRADALMVAITALQAASLFLGAVLLRLVEPAHARMVRRLHSNPLPGDGR